MDSICLQVNKVISRVLKKPVEKMKKGEKWDSLTHLKIVMELEDHFKISFGTKEVFAMESVDEICGLVKQHLHDKS